MRNNSAQCAEDEREIKYFDFRTFGAAAPCTCGHHRPRLQQHSCVIPSGERDPAKELCHLLCEIFRYAQNDKTKNSKNHNSQLVTRNFFHTRIMHVRHAREIWGQGQGTVTLRCMFAADAV